MKNLNQNILTSINDAYVDTSSTVYDGIWPPSSITHINEERMKYNYDAMGHQIIVLSPYKAASRQPRKIRFEYFPKERKAHTINYTQDGNIDTYAFADTLMRAIQTKQTGVVWNGGSTSKGSIVSGRAVLDAFGRNIASYYPTTESYGTMEGVYINGAPQGITFHEMDNFTLYPAEWITQGGPSISLALKSHKWTKWDNIQRARLNEDEVQFSPNENYHVQINSSMYKNNATHKNGAKAVAHELYSYILYMFRGWDSAHGSNREADNQKLENWLQRIGNETDYNFDH